MNRTAVVLLLLIVLAAPATATPPPGPYNTVLTYPGKAAPPISVTKQANANNATFGDFPWTALIRVRKQDANGQWLTAECSGSLIHPRFILTAAHCWDDDALGYIEHWSVSVRGLTRNDPEHQVLGVLAATAHPDYTGDQVPDLFDVAILELSGHAFASTIRVAPSAAPVQNLLAGWGKDSPTTVPNTLQWGLYDIISNANGYLELVSADGSAACKGDSGGPYVAWMDDQPYVTAVHVAAGPGVCGDSTLWFAIPTHVAPIRDFVEAMVPGLDTLDYQSSDERDRKYTVPGAVDSWVGHALQWKAYRHAATHSYFPPAQFFDPPIDCGWEPQIAPNEGEATYFFPGDPAGGWGCWPTGDIASLYLGIAYSLYRWNSPAFIQASTGEPIAVSRLIFDVRDADTGLPATLEDACDWGGPGGPPLTAQAAADLCDQEAYDIALHHVDGYEWVGQPFGFAMCAATFDEVFAPGFDIVFDPPEGVQLITADQVAAHLSRTGADRHPRGEARGAEAKSDPRRESRTLSTRETDAFAPPLMPTGGFTLIGEGCLY